MDSGRGWSDLLHLSVQQGGFDAHMTLRNKDLPARIRYSSIPESSDQVTWIPGMVRKRRNFKFFHCVCMLNRQEEPNTSHPRFTRSFTLLKRGIFINSQFCPSTLAFILWVSHSPIVLIWRRSGPFRLSRSPSLRWACMWYIECVCSYWHRATESKWGLPRF